MILYVVGVEGTDRVEIDSIWQDKRAAKTRADEMNRQRVTPASGGEPNWAVAEVTMDTPAVALDFTAP